MKVELATLYWPGSSQTIVQAHQAVTQHFQLPINYYEEKINHGYWMDQILKQSDADVIGILDGDCVPLSRQAILDCIKHVKEKNSFIGVAQVSNHIHPKSHIYAAPAFFFITKECWKKVNVSFTETMRSDVGEEFCYRAEELGIKYRCLYPTTYEQEPEEGLWPLSNYGYYGIGTTFGTHCYHLYQSRLKNNAELFEKRCKEIIDGTFNNTTHCDSKTFRF